jgi:outer membrane protein, heavy metal efflux system
MRRRNRTAAWAVVVLGAWALPGALPGQSGPVPAVGSVPAQPHWTEAEVVAAVQAGSLALAAARTGAVAAAEGPAQVRWPFPMVEVMPMVGAIADGEPGAQVMARQPIPWPGRLAADRAARGATAAAAGFEAEALELELVRLARSAYAELWGLQEQARLIAGYTTQLRLYREAALGQYAAGRGPQQAVLGIQLESEMLAQRLEALSESVAGVAAELEALTGGRVRVQPGDSLASPAGAGARRPSPDGTDLDGHPVVAAGRAMEAAERSMADGVRTMLRPELSLGVNLNLSRMAFDRMYGQEPVMPAIGLSLPLWRGGVRAEIRAAELRASQRGLEAADARLALEAELRDVVAQMARVEDRIARYEDRLRPQVRQTLDASMAGYQAGTTRFLELLDARRMALEVETDLIMARVRHAQLGARLDAVVGHLPRGDE